jgi:hypothetical protein
MHPKSALKRGLLEALGQHLSPQGFKAVLSQQTFRRPTPSGWLAIHLSFINHDSDFDIVLNAAVRFHKVQDAILPPSRDRKHTATIGCEYGRLTGQGQFRWTIERTDEIGHVAKEIHAACIATMIPFLERYADEQVVLDALRRDDATSSMINPIPERRARIVAFMDTMTPGKSI